MIDDGPLTRAGHETRDQISDVQEDPRNVSWEDQDQEKCDINTKYLGQLGLL